MKRSIYTLKSYFRANKSLGRDVLMHKGQGSFFKKRAEHGRKKGKNEKNKKHFWRNLIKYYIAIFPLKV